MKLKNILIVVDDIEISKRFYKELFGLDVVVDFDGNVILTEGLVLQERKIWEDFVKKDVSYGHHDAELYFEENQMDAFIERLEKYQENQSDSDTTNFQIRYVNPLMEHDWGQRVVRIYDPDMHVIEVGETLEYVARRFLKMGMTPEETARKTQLPLSMVEALGYQESE